jgi:hypothetical protein
MMNEQGMRRREFCTAAALLSSLTPAVAQESLNNEGFRPIFDGSSLNGWKAYPRKPGDSNIGKWTVENGVISGGQDPPGSGMGAYLVSEEAFFNFELQLEARPDWPIDTGIYLRTVPAGNLGIQVLLDHRPQQRCVSRETPLVAGGGEPVAEYHDQKSSGVSCSTRNKAS